MTMNDIVIVVSAFITLVMGAMAKKFNWVTKNYIPYQNLIIGIIVGIIAYCTELVENPISAIITGCASTLMAGGIYDVTKVGDNDATDK